MRITPQVKLHICQGASRSVDGVAANLAVVNGVMSSAILGLQSGHMAFIDMRKAFDSIPHSCIIGELRARVFLNRSVGKLLRFDGETLFGGERIKMSRGETERSFVTSPLQYAGRHADMHWQFVVGFMLGETKVQTFAFADDVVLFVSTL